MMLSKNIVSLFAITICINITSIPFANADDALSYAQARQRLRLQSDAIHASNYQVNSERERRHSLDSLDLPTLSISAGVMAYGLKRELNIEPLQQVAGQLIPGAEQYTPSSVDLDFNSVNPAASITSSWLLYTGGRNNAARRFADAGIALAEAERTGTIEHQEKLLATVYFGHLLAKRVLRIREDVLAGVKHHLHQATRFEAKGILSKVERLHAQVAFDEARRNLEQARADYGIANVTLRRLLKSEQAIEPLTQLFVLSRPLAPLTEFINAGYTGHSQLALLRAKHKQAEQGKVIEQARWKPTVVAYGSYNLVQEDADFSNPLPLLEPDWVVGVNISYPIFDRYNRSRLVSAAEQQIQRVSALEREVAMGIATFIEKSYRSVERARDQFMLLASSIELAQETLNLRERLFTEGLGTSLDVVDARLAVARAETERAVAAYDFVLSLVDLLEASGQIANFTDYVARADIRLSIEEKAQ
ncbi:TolC family protein [Paraglaciecola sp. L3A3]|uniref:TolC family protein n=1 Tax=Paraglaciecola sp. L3A3 TaxID=2686358 RepID=UPI00131A89B8|nr:TolC family protein [Paraglaciecola sp. L3A3]